MAPAVGFEPTTKRLTAARSTTELRRNGMRAAEAPAGPSASRAGRRKDTADVLAEQQHASGHDRGKRERDPAELEPCVADHDHRRGPAE